MISRTPFVGFVLCFCIGLLSASWLPINDALVWSSAGIILTFFIALLTAPKRFGAIPGFFSHGAMVLMGMFTMELEIHRFQDSLDNPLLQEVEHYIFLVESLPQKRTRTLQFTGRVEQVRLVDGWHKVDEKLLIMLPLEASIIPSPGNRMLIMGQPERPAAPLNPNQFDYRRFLRDKGIFRTDFVAEDSYKILSATSSVTVRGLALKISEASNLIFRKAIADDKAYALVKAMLLGRRDDLRTDQVDDFAVSGAVHILSVSGLHVGILYLVFAGLLGWLKRIRGGRFLYLLSMLSLLGFYALLTGLPDSVIRATIMFGVILLAQTYQRRSVSMNSLAISALLILLFDPRAIYHVGFQLSYMAMTGILLFYKPIKWLWAPRGRLLIFLWEVTCLSLAAQLATFPLAVYYFHQFPVYFWLVNPLVLIVAEFLLQSAVALLIFESIHLEWLSFLAGFWLQWSAYLTNLVVAIPKNLPGNMLHYLYLDRLEVLLLYGAIGFVWLSIRLGRRTYLIMSGCSLVIWCIYSSIQSSERYISNPASFFSVPRQDLLGWKNGKKFYVLSQYPIENQKEILDYHLKNYVIESGADSILFVNDSTTVPHLRNLSGGWLLEHHNKMIYMGPLIIPPLTKVDLALITTPLPKPIPVLNELPTRFLMGGSLSRYKKTDFIKQGKPALYHDLSEGSFQF